MGERRRFPCGGLRRQAKSLDTDAAFGPGLSYSQRIDAMAWPKKGDSGWGGTGSIQQPWGNAVPCSPSAEHLRPHAKSFGNHQPHCECAAAGHPGNAGGDRLLTPSDRSTVPTPKEGKLHRKAGTELRFATGAKKK